MIAYQLKKYSDKTWSEIEDLINDQIESKKINENEFEVYFQEKSQGIVK